MEDELLELWNLIQKKQDKMNRHAETCGRQLHRYQQQLRQLSEEYNFLMSQRPIQHLFEEVKNPNRARLDLAAKSASERERYAEQREQTKFAPERSSASKDTASPYLMGPGTTPFNTIFEDQVYEFGKRRRLRASTEAAKPLRRLRASTEAAKPLRRRSNKRRSRSRRQSNKRRSRMTVRGRS